MIDVRPSAPDVCFSSRNSIRNAQHCRLSREDIESRAGREQAAAGWSGFCGKVFLKSFSAFLPEARSDRDLVCGKSLRKRKKKPNQCVHNGLPSSKKPCDRLPENDQFSDNR